MNNIESTINALKEALIMLAHTKEKQILFNGPGCVSCDLLNDFDYGYKMIKEDQIDLSSSQLKILNDIMHIIDIMDEKDYECFNNEVLSYDSWITIRQLSNEALSLFNWERIDFDQSEQEDGVWRRKPLK